MDEQNPQVEQGYTGRSAKKAKARRKKQAIQDIIAFLIKLAVLAILGWVLFGLVFGVAVMEGEDMYPRIRDGDLMVYYRMENEYHIGDVVTFTQDGRRCTGRIVAQGGDSVDFNESGQLLVNGSVQDEEVFYPTQPVSDALTLPYRVPPGSVFLLCDFRTNATDSRTYGAIPLEDLDGKILTIIRRRGI